MKCADAHLAIGAEPQSITPELERHLLECASCTEYRREMLALDENIQRALKLDLAAFEKVVPFPSPVRRVAELPTPSVQRASSRTAGNQWALAASVLFALGVMFVLWGALPRHSLAADVVAHVISEPVPKRQSVPVPPATLAGVLEKAHLRMDPLPGQVTFAQTCFLRGRLVPHFVVRTDKGPLTVLILPNEHVKAAERFSEGGYTGILLPDEGRGSIAVLSRQNVDAEQPAREILGALNSKLP
ncbi:MAG: DUF3379 family protein [Gammaproteobacteria bacterium]